MLDSDCCHQTINNFDVHLLSCSRTHPSISYSYFYARVYCLCSLFSSSIVVLSDSFLFSLFYQQEIYWNWFRRYFLSCFFCHLQYDGGWWRWCWGRTRTARCAYHSHSPSLFIFRNHGAGMIHIFIFLLSTVRVGSFIYSVSQASKKIFLRRQFCNISRGFFFSEFLAALH